MNNAGYYFNLCLDLNKNRILNLFACENKYY